MLEITSSQNKIIKEIKSLHRRKIRWEKQLFIIEGIKIVEEARDNNLDLKYIIYTDKILDSEEGLRLFNLIKNERYLIKTSQEILNDISDTDNPQGIIGVRKFEKRQIEEVFKMGKPSLLYLDEIQDPGNMGTIIRTADAFKLDGIIVGKGSVDPYNPKVVRSTMGSIFRMPMYFPDDYKDFFTRIKKEAIRVITSSLEGRELNQDIFSNKFLLIIGNEAKGVKKDLVEMADVSTKIPMPGRAESLNAGVAASILMYEAMKSRKLEL